MVTQNLHRALDRDAILRALSSFYGITTADGTPTTLFCDALIGSNDFITGKTILLQSGLAILEDSGATAFDDTNGEITVSPAFSSPVLAGTGFYVLNASSAAALANIIRDIGQTTGTFAFDESAAGEQTVFSVAVAARAKVGAIWLDLNTLTLNNTIRIKHKIDGAAYRTFSTHSWVFATDDKGVLLEGFTAYRDFQVTMQCAGGGAAGKNIPYAVV